MKSFTILVSCASFIVTGCASFNTLESQARVDPRSAAHYTGAGELALASKACQPQLRGDSYAVAINLDCFRFPATAVDGQSAYSFAASKTDRTDRNRLASILIKHSDDVCVKELGDMNAREAISNTALGVATSALSTIGAIVSGERAKTILAGGSAFTNATRDHVNAEVFRNVLTSAMARAIQGQRDVMRSAIRAKFSSGPADYNVDEMIMDVNQYHQSCSFYNGLVLVVDAVNRASPSIAGKYRDISAAIADLKAEITDIDRQLAAKPGKDLIAALEGQKAGIAAQLLVLQVERSTLRSTDELATGKVAPPKTAPATSTATATGQ